MVNKRLVLWVNHSYRLGHVAVIEITTKACGYIAKPIVLRYHSWWWCLDLLLLLNRLLLLLLWIRRGNRGCESVIVSVVLYLILSLRCYHVWSHVLLIADTVAVIYCLSVLQKLLLWHNERLSIGAILLLHHLLLLLLHQHLLLLL